MLLDGKDHQLFKDLVTHEELLRSTGNVSVVVHDSHASESGNVHLHGDVSGQISMNLGLLAGMNSRSQGSNSIVKTLVSDLVDHLLFYRYLL